ncbi:MAG: DegT/DnrJ/EryC1/StrS family aminotransferase [Armatimonadota bacterium]|nr:DegT/DnrJ/EryC1/StrS family aminotransferase [Armatimonadota bacterium]
MPIKVWDYLAEYEAEREDILAGVEKVFRSGWLIFGESLKQFEQAFPAYCGVAHGVGVDNGTNGLTLALRALGIGAGDEVITTSNTAVPTVSAIVTAGATPRFVEIERDTYLMDVDQLEAAITPRTRCILPVHLYGQCVAIEKVLEVARRHNLKVLEDCAQSHGAERHGRKAGSWGHAAVFSFYPTKTLGAYGDAGMVITNDETLAAKLRRLRFYGMEKTYYAEEHGYNSRVDEIQAEILLRKLPRLDGYIARRQHLARRYEEILGGTSLILPRTAPGNKHTYYVYVCRHPERDRIVAELREREIFVNISYPWPIHIMRGYQFLGYREGDFPETEAAAKEIFSLPMYPSLSERDQDTVCRALGEILGEPVAL